MGAVLIILMRREEGELIVIFPCKSTPIFSYVLFVLDVCLHGFQKAFLPGFVGP